MNQTDNRKLVTEIFYASLKAVDPYVSVKSHAGKIRSAFTNGNFNRLLVAGFGKAVCSMSNAIEDGLVDIIDKGIVITKYGHISNQQSAVSSQENAERGMQSAEFNSLLVTRHPSLRIFEAGHPIPDENGVTGTDEIIKLLKSADENTLVVCLISGGGSALLVSPYKGITLNEKQELTQLLLKAGADINELNTVRKHISKVKGGRLAEIAYPAKVISLILSDVIGDKLDVIASGPTSPDNSTFSDALNVLHKYGLIDISPKNIVELLEKGVSGLIPETPKKGDKIFNNVDNIILGSNRIAVDAAKNKAEELGFHAEIISVELTGEAKDVGKCLAQKAIDIRKRRGERPFAPTCLISGGETTVTVKGSGIGGRNMELALAFAIEIDGIDGIIFLSAGTDGTDGPTDAAGAIVDGNTVKKAKAAGLDPLEYLANNDSYNFFKKIEGIFITGPTGTNVMDIQIMVIE
jgi:hydroxypyruvate reductase/glycerate 2-kinase